MRNFIKLSGDALINAVRDLKKNARGINDVIDWLSANAYVPGVSINAENVSLKVEMIEPYVDWNSVEDLDNVTGTSWVTMTVSSPEDNMEELAELLNLDGYTSIPEKYAFKMVMPYREWRFLTTSLLMTRLYKSGYMEPDELDEIEKIIDKYLPIHFNGLTYTMLKDLESAGMLPLNEIGYLDSQALLDLLFVDKDLATKVPLPLTDYLDI